MSADSDAPTKERSGKGRRLWPLFVLVLLLLVAVFLLRGRGPSPDRSVEERPETEEVAYTRSAVLYYAAANGEDLVAERREITLAGHGREEFATRLVLELARPPVTEGAYAPLPEGTRVRGVFFDDLGDLYVDFVGSSLADRNWGTSSEILAIRSIVRTLCGSFPELLRVGFLIDGEEVETLAGHVDASHPFEGSEWR